MALRLAKERIDLRISFGFHETTKHALHLEQHVREFEPHVFVIESADIIETERKESIDKTNRIWAKCRGNVDTRADALRFLRREFNGFEEQVLRIISSSRHRINPYIVEGYTEDEIKLDCAAAKKFEEVEVGEILAILARGAIEEALARNIKAMRRYTAAKVIPRNKRIVDGFEIMCEELPELFERTLYANPLRVLARYGIAHEAVVEELRKLGFNVAALKDSEVQSPRFSLIIDFSKNILMEVSAEQQIIALFDLIYSYVFPYRIVSVTELEFGSEMNNVFRRLGGATGFVELLRATANATNDLDVFERMMRERFS